jgi:acyl-CoA thioester hydrolase/thioesterase-3
LTLSPRPRHSAEVSDQPTVPSSDEQPVSPDPAGTEQPATQLVYSKFETELRVRPDDIDMYQHVHSSRYMDYVLAARFDQMEHGYKMPMTEFAQLGYGWFMATAHMNFKSPLELGDRFVVRTWIEKFTLIGVKVQFQIIRLADQKLSCDGWFDYVMVSIETGRAVRIPESIRSKYSV